MYGIDFEKFCKKYKLETPYVTGLYSPKQPLTYKDQIVCWFIKNPETSERLIIFPKKWFSVSNYEKACKCFEKYCSIRIKEIENNIKMERIKEDFQ